MPDPSGESSAPVALCSEGHADPRYSCRFCHKKVHRGDSGCGCSTLNEPVTRYSSLCIPCARALAELYDDTVLGMIHRNLVREARMTYMPSSD